MERAGLDRWHEYLASHDRDALWALLHPTAVFESPIVHTPQRGRVLAHKYLTTAAEVLGGPTFRYLAEWHNDEGSVLEFETELDEISVNGVDIIRFDDDGRITHFKVMVRPLKAITILHARMGERLQLR